MLGPARYPVFLCMTKSELRRMLEIGIARDDLASEYDGWINRGIRAVQRDHSYNCMRHVGVVTMTSGTSSVLLPSDFKELQPQKGSVSVFDAATGYYMCEVTTREKLIRQSLSARGGGFQASIFLSSDGNVASLNFLDTTLSDVTFSVAYFRFLPPLLADTDENYLTREFEDLVQAKIKHIAFSAINDPQASTELAAYEIEKRRTIPFDARQRIQGQLAQMGG
jgi:hypothetical protein